MPISVFISPQEVAKTSTANFGLSFGSRVITFIKPPTASEPNKVDAGPLTTSVWAIILFGIPFNP